MDRVDSLAEKSMEYQQMFKDFMDALDSVRRRTTRYVVLCPSGVRVHLCWVSR